MSPDEHSLSLAHEQQVTAIRDFRRAPGVGVDPSAMVEVLNESTGMSWTSKTHIGSRVISRTFDDPFKLELMLKDVGIANALALEAGVSVPLSGLSQQLWQAASLASGAGASVSELARWVENQSGVQITPGASRRDGQDRKT